MPLQSEGTFRLESHTSSGGVTWGGPDQDIIVLSDGFSISDPPMRVSDTSDPFRSGILFGRDFLDGPTMSWSLAFRDDGGAVWQDIANFQVNWRDAVVYGSPAMLSPITFTLGGRTMRAWGRTRKLAITPATVSDNTFQIGEATFQLAQPVVDLWSETRKSFDQTAALTVSGGSTYSQTSFVSDSQAAGPMVITITASSGYALPAGALVTCTPSSGGGSWRFTTGKALPAGATLVIDTRTRMVTVNGVADPAALTRDSSLTQTVNPAGGKSQSLTFATGSAPGGSNSATMTLAFTNIIPI